MFGKRIRMYAVLGILLLFPILYTGAAECSATAAWKLVWSDEFNGTSGSPPDTQKWSYDVGGDGWGNEELEYYTDRLNNSYQENGNLVIKVIKEDFKERHFTSARLVTKGRFEQAYGRFEARIKIPSGKGIWPAFWLIGSNYNPQEKNWPECGEIDIMENVGGNPSVIHASMHGPEYSDETGFTQKYSLPDNLRFSLDYHIFAVEWQFNEVRFFVDGYNFYTVKKEEVLDRGRWVFDKPFYIVLNVAVGGDWPGSPDETTIFPQYLYVDYVRVFKR